VLLEFHCAFLFCVFDQSTWDALCSYYGEGMLVYLEQEQWHWIEIFILVFRHCLICSLLLYKQITSGSVWLARGWFE
jgi:hypothetical protein